MGWLTSSWMIRSEWTDDSQWSTPSVRKPKSAAIMDGERGFVARITAPRTEQALKPPSGLPWPKAP